MRPDDFYDGARDDWRYGRTVHDIPERTPRPRYFLPTVAAHNPRRGPSTPRGVEALGSSPTTPSRSLSSSGTAVGNTPARETTRTSGQTCGS